MKIRVTYSRVYDTENPDFRQEWEESLWGTDQGYDLDFDGLQNFIKDRFINPNFDTQGNGYIRFTIVPEYLQEEGIQNYLDEEDYA